MITSKTLYRNIFTSLFRRGGEGERGRERQRERENVPNSSNIQWLELPITVKRGNDKEFTSLSLRYNDPSSASTTPST